jgi:hypothetical protein
LWLLGGRAIRYQLCPSAQVARYVYNKERIVIINNYITLAAVIAAIISATCALITVYMYRSQGKGFVWTKDPGLVILSDKNNKIHVQINIPLYNLGKGNIKFTSLIAKKINVKTKAMEKFNLDMDEAYFPEGSLIIVYKSPVFTEMEFDEKTKSLILMRDQFPSEPSARKEIQDSINRKISEVPETIFILNCMYKDGSWFGLKSKNTIIGLTISGMDVNYLSRLRRKELNEFFEW